MNTLNIEQKSRFTDDLTSNMWDLNKGGLDFPRGSKSRYLPPLKVKIGVDKNFERAGKLSFGRRSVRQYFLEQSINRASWKILHAFLITYKFEIRTTVNNVAMCVRQPVPQL